MRDRAGEKVEVRDYWNARPCDAEDWSEQGLSLEYFDDLAKERYRTHPYVPGFADFDRWKGKKVLEIGVGAGTDLCRWARAGADTTGIDLTETAVNLTRTNLKLHELNAEVRQADAEQLPFADDTFDLCYSFGVIHHTPRVEKALREVKRVLKPGGEIEIMLYHLRSWVTLRTYLDHGLFRGKPFASVHDLLASHKESPGTKAYTIEQIRTLFSEFDRVRVSPQLTTYDLWEGLYRSGLARRLVHALWPAWLVRISGDRFGWNLLITGRKADNA